MVAERSTESCGILPLTNVLSKAATVIAHVAHAHQHNNQFMSSVYDGILTAIYDVLFTSSQTQ